MLAFEWNQAKARVNLRKHGVSFTEAQSVFYDESAIQYYDEENSGYEDRFILLGLSNESNLLMVSHSEREGTGKSDNESIRIISARKATKSESKYYSGDTQ